MILRLVRIGLPAAIAAAGVVLLIVGDGENDQGAGVALIGVALVDAPQPLPPPRRLLQRDREREEAAREHFDRTGRWPDDGALRSACSPACTDRPPARDPAGRRGTVTR